MENNGDKYLEKLHELRAHEQKKIKKEGKTILQYLKEIKKVSAPLFSKEEELVSKGHR